MDDPLWPVVRESARRVLRIENISMKIPNELEQDFKILCDAISQNIPSRLVFPKVEYGEFESVEIFEYNSQLGNNQKIIVIGMNEPVEMVCWIESEKFKGWKWLLESCHDLLLAGYPGCIGCGGPNSEEIWDELEFRSKRKLAQEKNLKK